MRGVRTLAVALLALAAQASFAAPDNAAAPVEPQSWAPPEHVTLGDLGVPGLRVERGYAPSPLGQVHYQDVGPVRAPVVVLLHQVPWFYVFYQRAQVEFALRGIRTVAIDLPGYGLSARPDHPPTIAEYATAVDAVIRRLGLPRTAVVGHHTGSTVGAELARARPEHVACLVMHGVPIYTPAEARARIDGERNDLTYKPDGSHFTDRWTYLEGRIAGSLDSRQWSVLALQLAGEHEWYGHDAVFRYDMAGTLAALRVPVVVVSNAPDLLDFTFERVRALRPDFTYRRLEGRSSSMAFDEPQPWVSGVLEGLESGCGWPARRHP